MSYSMRFTGRFKLSRPLTVKEMNTLNEFAGERHERFSEFPDLAEKLKHSY
jgi:hypothetical protein